MSLVNNLPEHTVKVANGSGCIFRPLTNEYLYILTAKHVVENVAEPLIIQRQTILENGDLNIDILEIIGGPYYNNDVNKDAAIIKVKNFDFKTKNELQRVEDLFENINNYYLAGHPDAREDNEFSFRSNKLSTLSNPKQYGYIEASLERSASYSEIIGQSGGGIIKVEDHKLFLAGIQKQMSATDEQELLGQIDFMPLSFYDEIVASNAEALVPILPYYLKCFSLLKEHAMKLEGCFVEGNITYTRNYLKNLTNSILESDLTPLFIKDYFKEKLLIHNEHPQAILEKGLWIGWLEFLIIMNIIKGSWPMKANVEDIFNDIRLIYSDTTNDWTTQIENIIKSNFKGLKDKGRVLVYTDTIPVKSVIPGEIVLDVVRSNNIQKNEFQIDDGITHPLVNYKLIHLHAFQKECIVSKEGEYKDFTALNENDLLIKLKAEYESLFK